MSENLTRVSGVHNSQQTWAVHDDKFCVYLAVTETGRLYSGVFCCFAYPSGDDCPWLGNCDGDAYVTRVARPIYDAAVLTGWDEQVIYRLLTDLHSTETAGGGVSDV